MEKQDFKAALDLLKANSEKKKFNQAVDIIVNLKNLDLKKPDQQVDLYMQLHHGRGRKVKIACLCGPELLASAKATCDLAIPIDEFSKYSANKKLTKKLASDYDFFLAQVTIMPDVAKHFGRVLGPKSKMPNPKAGAVVPANANLKSVVEKFSKTVRLTAKSQLSIKANVGKEDMPEAELLDNAFTIYETLLKALPQETNNIKNVLLKYTMSSPIPVGVSAEDLKKMQDERKQRQAEAIEFRKKQAEAMTFKPKKQKVEKKSEETPSDDGASKAPEQKAGDAAGDDAEKPKKKRASKKSKEAEE